MTKLNHVGLKIWQSQSRYGRKRNNAKAKSSSEAWLHHDTEQVRLHRWRHRAIGEEHYKQQINMTWQTVIQNIYYQKTTFRNSLLDKNIIIYTYECAPNQQQACFKNRFKLSDIKYMKIWRHIYNKTYCKEKCIMLL